MAGCVAVALAVALVAMAVVAVEAAAMVAAQAASRGFLSGKPILNKCYHQP